MARFLLPNNFTEEEKMLDYESFKKKVMKEFLLYMPEDYSVVRHKIIFKK